MGNQPGENDVQINCPFCAKEVLHDYEIEGGFDDFAWNPCEHVVFATSGGIDGLFDGEDYYIHTGEQTLDTMIFEDLDSALEILQSSCPERTFASEGGHVERGGGERGGGPSFKVIFAASH